VGFNHAIAHGGLNRSSFDASKAKNLLCEVNDITEEKPHGQLLQPPKLDADGAAALRERMLADIGALASEDEAADWDHKNLSAKNAFGDDDAKLVEARFREKLAMVASTSEANNGLAVPVTDTPASHVPQMGLPNEDSAVATASSQAQLARPVTTKPIRLRDKEHCRFVATHPCIICGRGPLRHITSATRNRLQ
jgi:hypothetical protein